MGNVYRKLFAKKPVRIIMMGLDSAGKTTMLYKLKLGDVVTTIPCIGFNIESISFKNLDITSWDVGGRDKLRPLWRHYYATTDAIICVVDSNDRERIDECKDELHRMVNEEELKDVPILVLANKQDLCHSMSIQMIIDKLDLNKFRNRNWYICGTCATSGDGLYEGLDWLANQIAYTKAKETSNHIRRSTTNTVSETKLVKVGWEYAVSSIMKINDWFKSAKQI